MNYDESFRRAQASYDAMTPPEDPPWLEQAISDAGDDIRESTEYLMEAMQEPEHGYALLLQVSSTISAVLSGSYTEVVDASLRAAVYDSAVRLALSRGE